MIYCHTKQTVKAFYDNLPDMRVINCPSLYVNVSTYSVFSWCPVFVVFISPPLISYHFPASLSAAHNSAGV